MAIVAFSSIFLLLPWLVVQVLYTLNRIDEDAYVMAAVITFNILILQYCINMFIYVWRKDNYRHAIIDVFAMVIPKCGKRTESHRHSSRYKPNLAKIKHLPS